MYVSPCIINCTIWYAVRIALARVEIRITFQNKHKLPVGSPCRYNHVGTIAVKGGGCLTVDGRAVENVDDIELCMEEADCTIEGVLTRTAKTGKQFIYSR